MSFTRFQAEVGNISALSNTPNVTDGLSGAQLRARFDKAAEDIKAYLNNVLLVQLEGTGSAGNLGITEIDGLVADTVQEALEALYQAILDASQGEIPDGSVTTQKLADTSVTAPKIAAGAVTMEKTTGVQAQHKTKSVTVPAITAGGTQTVSGVTGVTENNTVLVEPAPASYLLWRDCGVRVTAQGTGTLSFTAEDATGESLTANVLILD